MGFYLKKSIRVGPFRFNLSKSGVGISAGIKGLRLGVGPRGNYVHMGRGGLYYRATLPPLSSTHKTSAQARSAVKPEILQETHSQLQEIESSDISLIVDSSSRELLDELNQKRMKKRVWPAIAIATVIFLSIGLSSKWPNWLLTLLTLICIAGVYTAYVKDSLKKTVVLFYEFDDDMAAAYAQLHKAASQLSKCVAAWHIEASGKVLDRKYHAGASDLVRRKRTSISKAEPPYVKTNIETVAIEVGRQTLHFFPDRVLVYEQHGVGAVGYQELNIDVSSTRFIESEAVPRDAKIIDRTWEYVNKSGGPDKRFKNNKELPICQYEQIALSSHTGLNEIIQLSRCNVGNAFSEAIFSLGKKMPVEGKVLHKNINVRL